MLGYKLPVVWPGNDWFEADKSKPIASERRSRLRKSGRKRSQHRAKKRLQTPATSKKDKTRSFPGAFFGFGPESPKGTDATKTKDSEKPAPPKRSKRKKKSPSRAKKKPKPNPHSKKS
jgi:hypothetical protein